MTHWASRNLVGAWCPSVSGWGGTLLRDLSGNGNHGTLTNMDPATDWVVGSNGHIALRMDSASNFVSCGSGLLRSAVGTISLWFTASNVTTFQGLFGTRVGDSDEFNVLIGDGEIYAGNWSTSSVNSVTANTWHHVICSSNGSTWSAWLNGQRFAFGFGAAVNFSTFTGAWEIGLTRANRFQSGDINDVRLYDRPISEGEAVRLYQGGPGYGLRVKKTRVYFGSTATGNRRRRLICGAPT